MTTEEGIVIAHRPGVSWIKTQKTVACKSCSAKSSCSTLGGGKEMKVEAIDKMGAKVGDSVLVGYETSSLIKASFLLYIFPILCMIAGAVIGQQGASSFNLNASAMSAVTSFLFLFLSFLAVRKTGNRLAAKDRYKPKVIRILRRQPAAAAESNNIECQA